MSLPVKRLANGFAEYTTIDGDRLDRLCRRYYGVEWNDIDRVYDANRGLSSYGTVFPIGVKIVFPPKTIPIAKKSTFNLWS